MIGLDAEPLGIAIAALLAQTDPAIKMSAAAQPANVERGFRFLIGAYTVVWVVLAVYMFSVSVRLRRLSRQVRRLKERFGS